MATQDEVKIGVNVSDNGTANKVVKNLQEITKAANTAQRATGSVNVPAPVRAAMAPAGTSGSRAVAAKSAPAGSQQVMSEQTYGAARGSAGLTGAGARDFANQAQGLGGLVRLYATYAANLFAAEAAFRALSNAADTSNMVKGLDQLSVASGKSLGSLSKQLAAATDNAISMQESMAAVAQSSAAGLSGANIIRLGEVAKKTSQALGLSMPDAISRLSRGISKIEPELLDELGIFVKIDQASQDYARTIGKTASTLTDFEKRQGFANAVLTQAEEKFSNIKLDANPYTKLAASMKDLAQIGLELVNTVLTPIITLLAASPAGLATVMTTIGVLLLKQAIPALKEYKQYLNSISEASSAEAKARVETSRINARKEYDILQELSRKRDILAGDTAEKEYLAQKSTVEKITALQKTRVSADIVGAPVRGLLKKNIFELTPDELKSIKDRANVLSQSDDALYNKQGDKLHKFLDKTNKMYVEADNIKYQATEASINKDLAGTKKMQDSREKYGALTKQLALDSIRSSAVDTQAKEGMVAALKKVNAQLVDARKGTLKIDGIDDTIPKISRLERGVATLGVAFDLSKAKAKNWISKLGDSLDKLGLIGQVVGIAVGAFELLDTALSSAAKEIQAYDNSLEATKDSAKLLREVSSDLAKQDASKFLSAESMQARSNAINEASTSIKSMLKTLDKAKLESNWWDNLFDGLFSKSRLQKTADSIVSSIKESIKLARPSSAKDVFTAKVLEITGASSIETIDTSKLTRENLAELSSDYEQFGAKLVKSSADIMAPKKAFEALNKTFQDLSATLLPTDNISKYAMALFDAGVSLQGLTEDTNAYFEQLRSISGSNLQISMLGLSEKEQKALQEASPELNRISVQYNALTKAAEQADIAIVKTSKDLVDTIKRSESAGGSESKSYEPTIKLLTDKIVAAQTTIDNANKAIVPLVKAKEDFNKQFVDVGKKAITEGLELFGKSLNLVIEQGTLKLASAIAGAITGAGSAEARAAVALKEIDLRVAGNTIMADLIIKQQEATLALEANTNVSELRLIQSKLDAGDLKKGELKDALARKEQLENNQKVLSTAKTILEGGRGGMLERVSTAAKGTATEVGAAKLLQTTAFGVAKVGAESAAAAEEKKVIALNEALGKTSEKYTTLNREISTRISLLEVEYKDASQLASTGNSFALQELANQKAIAIEVQKSNLLTNESLKLEEDHKTKLEAAQKAGSNSAKLIAAENKSYQDQTVALGQKLDIQNATNKAAQLSRDLSDITKKNSIETYRLDGLKLAQDQKSAKETGGLTNQLAELDALKSTGVIQEEYYLREKSILDLKLLTANKTKEQNDLEDNKLRAVNAAKAAYDAQLTIINQSGDSAVQKEASRLQIKNQLTEAEARANSVLVTGVGLSNAKFATDSKILAQTLEYNIQLEKQNQLLNAAGSIADSLKTIFEGAAESSQKVAAAMGNVVTSLANFAVNADKGKNALAGLQKKQADFVSGKKDSVDVSTQITKQEAQNRIDEVKGYAQLAGAAKGMFKEKTFAYKAFAATEKVLHIASMAMNVQKMLSDKEGLLSKLATNAEGMASDVAAASVSAVKAVISAITGSFPMNVIAGAATAAVVYGLLGAIGGKSGPGVSGGGGAVQNDGTGTVLGDKSAKSTGVSKSIEILQNSDPVLMRNSTNMLKHLRSIDNNIAQFGASLAKSLGGGDISGRMGIQPGFKASNTGTALAFGALGLAASKLPVVGGIVSGLAKALGFGTKTIVRGQGIELGGQTLGEAATSGVDAGYYADVTKKKQALGITYSSKDKRQQMAFGAEDRDLQLALDRIFQGVYGTALSASETFGISNADMQAKLNAYSLQRQSIALSGTLEEQQAQLTAGIGKITDQVFLSVLSGYDDFQKGGETYANTISRIVYGTEEAGVALDTLGIDAIKFTDIVDKQGDIGAEIVRQSIVAQETGNQFIRDVIDSMAGGAQDIAELYNSLDTMRDSVINFGGSAEFVSLAAVKAAGGADKLGDAIANFYDKFTTDAQKTALNNKKVTSLFDSLNIVLPKTRAEMLTLVNTLTKTGREDAAAKIMAATDKLDAFYTALGDTGIDKTIDKFTSFADKLTSFRDNLLLGSQSILTPEQKYIEAKAQFETTAAKALAGDEAAQGKYESAAQSFLTASSTYFAGSEQYIKDFSAVVSNVNLGISEAETQINIAKQQLDLLGSIDSNIATLAGVPQKATGGRASGLTLVGERGPELVDFNYPGMVYPADQTRGMFAPQASVSSNMGQVVQELRQVKQELSQLRKDQQQQTGDIIISNYEANQKASEEIATAVVATSQEAAWIDRSKAEIK